MGRVWWPAYCSRVFHRWTGTDDNHYRHTLRLAKFEVRYTCYLAIRYESKVEGISTELSEHVHECAVVLRRGHLDISYPPVLWYHFLHNHHRHTIWKDAFPIGKVGIIAIWYGGRVEGKRRFP